MANNEFGFDFSNISKWEVKTKEFEIKTDGTDKDNAEGLKALAILVGGQKSQATKLVSTSLRDAIKEYEPFLAKTKQAEKSKKMAMSTLNSFVTLLGADFDMALIDDALIDVNACLEVHQSLRLEVHQFKSYF